ncbi:hypothetical protein EJB05_55210, partial [Eragrostis curvula]
MPAKPWPEPTRDSTPGGAVPFLQQPFACETYRLCPPPPAPPATVHLRSGRLPTPLIALSASLLAVSALLLLALLVYRLVLRRRRQNAPPQQHEAPQLDDDDEESVLGVAAVAWELGGEEEVDSGDGDGGVHHVWYIQTKGLDERAIAAIAAVVYDGAKMKKHSGGGGVDGDGGCAVCLAEFRDGETLRLLPRCGHAFHRGCIDTWLRAHVNCPLCRAPVQVAAGAAAAKGGAMATVATRPRGGGEAEANLGAVGGVRTEEEEQRGGGPPDRAVRRAASMVALPRRAWPDLSLRWPAASSSGREEEMTGLGKIRRLLKLSDAPVVAGVGRSVSFGAAGSCQRLPTRSGPSTAAGVNGDEIELSR